MAIIIRHHSRRELVELPYLDLYMAIYYEWPVPRGTYRINAEYLPYKMDYLITYYVDDAIVAERVFGKYGDMIGADAVIEDEDDYSTNEG